VLIPNPLKAELNPICHLLALLGAHHILHFSRVRVNWAVLHRQVVILCADLWVCHFSAALLNGNN